ncbi:HflK protein [Chthoniobacter flavus Ellin428]|uniref:Protein HflK n=1 Tax=Chthoniobacter flavus Ellin428 TaxID=497964 RepID=B4D926_9BACT|nr:FtsH protease activity modulator HflK [Chthoniobacter flavus]EDY17071.1 HflK protein [Chthoniobacter flavus Ellin428]TCO86163.1 protease FtsH subunit HflK [Chthoniobacter flavus]
MPPPLPPRTYNVSRFEMPQFNFRWVWRVILIVIVIWALLSCYSSVPADSVGVLQRFGKFQEIVQPGLVFKLPLGIDKITLVEVQRQNKVEFGFGTEGATNPDQESRDSEAEQTMVTGDLNMALVEWVVQYRIEDPKEYLFHVYSPGQTLRDASESAMREVVGDRTVDEVLTIGRQEIENETLARLKELSKHYGLGISVMQVQLRDVHPPRNVQASFNEVNQAQQEKEQMINVANGEYNKAVPRARGEADQKIRAAEGYALGRVNQAQGDADRFDALLAEYLKAPEVTRERMFLETMTEIMPQFERKVIIDENASQLLPLLNLDGKTKGKQQP